MNAREAVKRARKAGATVEDVYRTGEIRIRAAGMKPVRISDPTRKKDASMALVQLVRKLEAASE
jgi:hypothetical protein